MSPDGSKWGEKWGRSFFFITVTKDDIGSYKMFDKAELNKQRKTTALESKELSVILLWRD